MVEQSFVRSLKVSLEVYEMPRGSREVGNSCEESTGLPLVVGKQYYLVDVRPRSLAAVLVVVVRSYSAG